MKKNEPNTSKHEIKPASPDEAGPSFAIPLEKDAELEEIAPLELHSLAALKRAIKPGAELMATYHANHPEIVGLIRVVTEVQSNAFYSVIKDQPDHKYSTCNYGKGFRSDFEKAANYQFDGTTVKVLDARKGDESVLCEFEVYEPEMKMEAVEENEASFTMTMGEMKAGNMPRCEGCPYGRHGFICCGKDGRCMRTEAARINHFKIAGEQDLRDTDKATDSSDPSGVEPTVPGGK